jgi:uroporphyrinogen decarboxylase
MTPVVDHAALRPDLFLRACRGEAIPMAPVWMMRQAGRYLPEYRALKEKHDFLTLCHTPELAAEVTLQPLRRFPLDAAILFSDILVPIEPMGVGLRFDPGPILERAINTEETIASLRPVEAEESCGFVMETIRILRRELQGVAPLIGFCGAPFTVGAYLAETREKGKTKGTFDTIASLIFERPDLAHRLIDHLTEVMAGYLSAQIRAGAQAVQIFDSWGGILGAREFAEFALEPVRRLIASLPPERGPVIYFVLNGGHLIEQIATSGADVIGVDWRTPLDAARARVAAVPEGARVRALQGNLDPHALYAPADRLRAEVRRVLVEGHPTTGHPGAIAGGHAFNLGHGILPDAPIASVETLVTAVHEISADLYFTRPLG